MCLYIQCNLKDFVWSFFFLSLISFNWLFCLFYSKLILKLHRRVWNQFWKLTNKQITKLIWLSNSREFLDPMKNYRIFRIERLVAMFTFKRRNCCFSRKFDTIFRVKIQKFKFNVRTLQLTHTHIHAGTRKTWCITFFSAETIMKFASSQSGMIQREAKNWTLHCIDFSIYQR